MWILMAGGYYFLFYGDQENQYNRLVREFSEIRKQRDTFQTIQFNIGRWQAEIARLDGELDKATTQLPTDKELPSLLQRIDDLARKSGLEIARFTPQKDKPMGFYAEVPIRVEVKGTFYELMIFLNQVSNLDRIVTIDSVDLSNPQFKNQKLLLQAQFHLITYRYLKSVSKKS
jgi:type IV pilus assembly protein PilO